MCFGRAGMGLLPHTLGSGSFLCLPDPSRCVLIRALPRPHPSCLPACVCAVRVEERTLQQSVGITGFSDITSLLASASKDLVELLRINTVVRGVTNQLVSVQQGAEEGRGGSVFFSGDLINSNLTLRPAGCSNILHQI